MLSPRSFNDDIYEWVGADDVTIHTYNGRIIRTTGLTHNIEIKKYREKILPIDNPSFEVINLYNPDLFSGILKLSFNVKQAKINKLEDQIFVNKIYEKFSLESIGWKGTNLYFQNKETQQIEALEQKIHPRLPKVKVEYYFKY